MKHLIVEHQRTICFIFNLKKVKKISYEYEKDVCFMVIKVGKEEYRLADYNNYRIKII